MLEILDDRYEKSCTIITSQLDVDRWHGYLGDPTVADAVLDRLVHNAYRLPLKGDSRRKDKAPSAPPLDLKGPIQTQSPRPASARPGMT